MLIPALALAAAFTCAPIEDAPAGVTHVATVGPARVIATRTSLAGVAIERPLRALVAVPGRAAGAAPVVLAADDRDVWLTTAGGGIVGWRVPVPRARHGPIALDPFFAATAHGKRIELRDAGTGRIVATADAKARVHDMRFARGGWSLVVTDGDFGLAIYDIVFEEPKAPEQSAPLAPVGALATVGSGSGGFARPVPALVFRRALSWTWDGARTANKAPYTNIVVGTDAAGVSFVAAQTWDDVAVWDLDGPRAFQRRRAERTGLTRAPIAACLGGVVVSPYGSVNDAPDLRVLAVADVLRVRDVVPWKGARPDALACTREADGRDALLVLARGALTACKVAP